MTPTTTSITCLILVLVAILQSVEGGCFLALRAAYFTGSPLVTLNEPGSVRVAWRDIIVYVVVVVRM